MRFYDNVRHIRRNNIILASYYDSNVPTVFSKNIRDIMILVAFRRTKNSRKIRSKIRINGISMIECRSTKKTFFYTITKNSKKLISNLSAHTKRTNHYLMFWYKACLNYMFSLKNSFFD